MRTSVNAILAADGLECGYAPRTVLSEVSFELAAGSSTILLGPNGSGKSTLLKTLVKSISPLGGSLTIGDRDSRLLSSEDRARLIAYVPQEEVPPFRFSVRQVVTMGRMPLSPGFLDTDEDRAAVAEAMREADCLELAERPIAEVSGGERQRALIARGLAQEAPLLLLDEPTSHLDIGHQVTIASLVRRLCQDGRAVLAAMHDLNLAGEMGDRAILLHEGRIVLDAPVEEVLTSPLLDKAYGVAFTRMRDPNGRLRVFAVAGSLG